MPVPTKEQILQALKPVEDPELRVGIVDLGLIYGVNVSEAGDVAIDLTLTAPGCPYGETFAVKVRQEVEKLEGVRRVEVALVFDPPWDPKERCSDHAKDELGIW